MRKRFLMALALVALCLASCDKPSYSGGESLKAHFVDLGQCLKIASYGEERTGTFYIKMKDGTKIFVHSAKVYIIEGNCPFCEGEEYAKKS